MKIIITFLLLAFLGSSAFSEDYYSKFYSDFNNYNKTFTQKIDMNESEFRDPKGRNVEEKNPKIFILSVIPSVIAFGAMFADFPYQLQILAVGFLIAWIIDLSLMFKDKRYYVYLVMRTFITGSVMYLHMYLL